MCSTGKMIGSIDCIPDTYTALSCPYHTAATGQVSSTCPAAHHHNDIAVALATGILALASGRVFFAGGSCMSIQQHADEKMLLEQVYCLPSSAPQFPSHRVLPPLH
jgi:hypothetical protein